ncbi:MAG: hypothetical protein KGJ55_03220 [Gammaproteobacteria bacterium]|nr:hypothetical protein [Gammaproteobacteria bacterium]
MSTQLLLPAVLALLLSGCVTSEVEQIREASESAHLASGKSVVVLSRRDHGNHEAEADFTECLAKALAEKNIKVYSQQAFLDALFPWLEPRAAPLSPDALPALLDKPEVAQRIRSTGVDYMVWVDGDTEATNTHGNMSCGLAGAAPACFGFVTWDKQSAYKCSVWDLHDRRVVGKTSVKATGTSFIPAIIVPIPLIARTQAAACRGLASQLVELLTSTPATGVATQPGGSNTNPPAAGR